MKLRYILIAFLGILVICIIFIITVDRALYSTGIALTLADQDGHQREKLTIR
jgi:hypothetical protein